MPKLQLTYPTSPPASPKTMTDTQFVQVRLIRKKYAHKMGRIAHRMRKLAREAIQIEQSMQAKARAITLAEDDEHPIPLASFVPHSMPFLPNFDDVERMTTSIMRLADRALLDNTIVISNEHKADYARLRLGITTSLPPDFNPAIGDRRISDKEEYETPAGGWIVSEEEEEVDLVPETQRTP